MKNKEIRMIITTLSAILSLIGMVPYLLWGWNPSYLAIMGLITSLLYLWSEKVNEKQYILGMPLSIIWLINGILWTLTLLIKTNI